MCSDTRENKGSGLIGFTVGALIGAAAGFYANTKSGRKFIRETWRKVEPYIEDAKDEIEDVATEAEDKVEQAVDQIKDYAKEAKEKLPIKFKNPSRKTFFKGL